MNLDRQTDRFIDILLLLYKDYGSMYADRQTDMKTHKHPVTFIK